IDITDHLSDVQSLFDEYRRIDLLATVGIFLCGIAAALYLSFRITSPLYSVVDAFERVSEGDLDTRVDGKNPGEFSVLAEQFNRMVESLAENRELERELAQRERVLHMGDLAAGVAHDVRNPLNAIHLNIGQIRDEFVPEDDESRERFLRFTSDVRREVERLNKLVSNFLSLAQPSGGAADPVDPNRVLRELERLLGKEAAARHVALSVDLVEELPTLVWDRQEMMSAFLNIAMNALQSMEPDGGSLEVVSTRRGNDDGREAVVLTFTDTGPGIAPEDLERVFVPYFTTRRGGTGLGLAIARRITERNGGRLELVSEVGTGTSVAFVFPLDRQPTIDESTSDEDRAAGGEIV
ncbi:MAG: ATP-binding protein, partial [Planctomycetota bacterium]